MKPHAQVIELPTGPAHPWVITGQPIIRSRKETEALLTSRSIKLASSFSRKTAVTLVFDNAGRKKIEKVIEYETRIILRKEVLALLNGKTVTAIKPKRREAPLENYPESVPFLVACFLSRFRLEGVLYREWLETYMKNFDFIHEQVRMP